MVIVIRRLVYLVPLVAGIIIYACGTSAPSPRQRVLEFVRVLQADSLADITPFVDLDSVATYEYSDSKYDSLTLAQKKRRLVDGFTGNGEYRSVWAKSQIVVNHEFIKDDTTARVEVSFIDRSTRIQYYSQMGLKLRGNVWIVTDFKANKESTELSNPAGKS